MSGPKLSRWQKVVLWRPLRFVLPTLTALYANRIGLSRELSTLMLPSAPWVRDHARQLLVRSDERLRGIEAKGPGLAALTAIIGAAVLIALVEGWDDATTAGRLLLALATWYAVFSLGVPIYLVGPQPRDTVDTAHLGVAASLADPEDYLARAELAAAQRNVRRTQRLGNLQDAARNELSAALAVLLAWAVLVPVTGLLVQDPPSPSRPAAAPTTATTGPLRTTPSPQAGRRTKPAASLRPKRKSDKRHDAP